MPRRQSPLSDAREARISDRQTGQSPPGSPQWSRIASSYGVSRPGAILAASHYARPGMFETINEYLSIYGRGIGQHRASPDSRGEGAGVGAGGTSGRHSPEFDDAARSAMARGNFGQPEEQAAPSAPHEVYPVPPLGDQVHPDWHVDPRVYSEVPTGPDGEPLPDQALAPPIPYYTHDDTIMPLADNWGSDRVLSLQKKLERANLLEEGAYRPGVWGTESQRAFQEILIQSNQSATPWDQTLTDFMNNPIPTPLPDRQSWVPETFIRPNPENVGESIYNMISQLVGSDYADDSRVARLTQSFMQEARNAFEEKQELERQTFEYEQTRTLADQTEHSFEDLSAHAAEEYGVEVEQPPEEVEVPDPDATLQRETREELEGIMSAQEQQERTQRSAQNLGQIFQSMSRWSG